MGICSCAAWAEDSAWRSFVANTCTKYSIQYVRWSYLPASKLGSSQAAATWPGVVTGSAACTVLHIRGRDEAGSGSTRILPSQLPAQSTDARPHLLKLGSTRDVSRRPGQEPPNLGSSCRMSKRHKVRQSDVRLTDGEDKPRIRSRRVGTNHSGRHNGMCSSAKLSINLLFSHSSTIA